MKFPSWRYTLLIFSAIAAVIAGAWVMAYGNQLKTTSAPMGIVSLEMAWTTEAANCVAESWNNAGVTSAAIESINVDCVFIPFYTLFLVLAVWLAAPSGNRWTRPTMALLILAGLCDVIENIFMKQFLAGALTSVVPFSLPATIKFTIIALAIGYIMVQVVKRYREKIKWLKHLLNAVYIYAAGILTIAVLYLALIQATEGQDILILLVERLWPLIFTVAFATLFAYYLWYSFRILGYLKEITARIPVIVVSHFPRMLAYNGLVCIQAAILSLPTIMLLESERSRWGFVFLLNGLYFIWTEWLKKKSAFLGLLVLVIVMGYAGVTIYLVTRDGMLDHQLRLPWVAFCLFLAALLMVWGFVYRRKKIDARGKEITKEAGSLRFFGTTVIVLPGWFEESEQSAFYWFNAFAGAGIVFYVAAFFWLGLANLMGPLAFMLLALGILVGLSNVLTRLSIRFKINIFLILLLWTMLIGKFYDPFKVRVEACAHPFKRPGLVTYFNDWVDRHREKIGDSDNAFPVYLVIADGGASRSGYWVASVLSALQDSTMKRMETGETTTAFSDHLLCLSGASGGSVGNATFYALLRNSSAQPDYMQHSQAFLKGDFLTPVFTRMLGSDLFQHLVPLPWLGDRAVALERSMERFGSESMQDLFAMPFDTVADLSGALPILCINSTYVKGGQPAVISTVQLDGFSTRVDVLDTLAKHDQMMRYSSAVVLGARFPYISPAGRIGNSYFVDGGYFDNSGAGMVHEMLQQLDSVVQARLSNTRADSIIYAKLKFTVIHIENTSTTPSGANRIHPVLNDLAAPVLTVLGTYSSQTNANDARLKAYLRQMKSGGTYREINLYSSSPDDALELPMNWVISRYNLDKMNDRVQEVMEYDLAEIIRLK